MFQPIARNRVVMFAFLFLSTFTEIISLLEVSNSIQAPLYGISFAEHNSLPVAGSVSVVKYAPGDLTS